MHALFRELIGQIAPRPYHVVVNGWYFYSINFISGGALLRSLPSMLVKAIRHPRHIAGIIPPTVRHAFPVVERMWREDLQPRYRASVADAEGRVETMPVAELPSLIDELAELAGEYFVSIAALSGAGYKLEMNLAQFYRRHLAALARRQPPAAAGRLRTGGRSRSAMPSRRSTGGMRLCRSRRRRRRPPRLTAAWSRRGRRPRPLRSRPWPRRHADSERSAACWPTRSTSSRFGKSRPTS